MQTQLLVLPILLLLFPQPILFLPYQLASRVEVSTPVPPEVHSTISQHPLSVVLVTLATQADVCDSVTPTNGAQKMELLVMFFIKCLSILSQDFLNLIDVCLLFANQMLDKEIPLSAFDSFEGTLLS